MSDYLPTYLMAYSDSSFTNPHEVARPDEPLECTGNFTHMGAKYWGFETLRHRATQPLGNREGHRFDHDAYHWFQLGLNNAAEVNQIRISTKWFTGNQVPAVSIMLGDEHNMTEVLSRVTLEPDQEHLFDIPPTGATTCLVRCYHEGGIARVSLYGSHHHVTDPPLNLLEFADISHVSNEHYGHPRDAVNGQRQVDYMLGWESARSGFGEQALFHLRKPTLVSDIIVDTYLHRLNPPLSCHVFGIRLDAAQSLPALWEERPRWSVVFDDGHCVVPQDFTAYMQAQHYLSEPVSNPKSFNIRLETNSPAWLPILSFGELHPDRWHRFTEIESEEVMTHLLYMHYPNGGIHGLKVFGLEQDR